MKISSKGRYALRLMIDLAESKPDEWVSLKDISARQGISVKYLEQIINTLNKSGLLRSSRGPQGGYMLAKKPEEYSVGEILRATEGSLVPVACLEDTVNQCSRYQVCPTISFWTGLKNLINDYVDSATLADLITKNNDDSNGDFMI